MLLAAVVVAAACVGWAGTMAAVAAAEPPSRWVNVSVATLWVQPGIARAVDAPSLSNPAYPRRWVASMSVAEKRWLVGRLETQALYGAHVYLLATSGSWSKVVVTSQPTPRDARGYPGWLPTAQLTSARPAAAPAMMVVRLPTAWGFKDAGLTERAVELSYGTRLPAVAWNATYVKIVLPSGRQRFVRRSAVALRLAGTAWPRATGAQVVAEAKRFLGLQYLWAGTSGFAYDCSGFTYSVYRALGITIPRDAGPQSRAGTAVASRSSLRPGDLLFFRNASGIHHVAMYIGGGQMIHSPGTGSAVRIDSIYSSPYSGEFAGGRRYVS